jgi:hypothetical protein
VDFISCLFGSKFVVSPLRSGLSFDTLECSEFDFLNPLLGARVPLVDLH